MRLSLRETKEVKEEFERAISEITGSLGIDNTQKLRMLCEDHLVLIDGYSRLAHNYEQLHVQLTDYSRRALEAAQMVRQLLPDPKAVQTAIERADQMIELVDPRWALMRRSEQETE